MMKKRSLLIYLLLLLPFLHYGQDKPLVLASASMFADMAEVISGGLVDVNVIVPIGGDPHLYEPTPADARLVTKADLILRNGLTFEGWINELIENSGTKARVVTITNGIQPIESEDYANSSDPHAWMSARNGLVYIRNVKDALVTLDPEHAEEYQFNYEIYRQQVEDLDRSIEAAIKSIPAEKRVLITSHDAFRYYGQRYGVRVEAVLGTSTDADVQTSDVIRLNEVLAATGVPAVFVESTVNPKLLQQVARDNDVIIGGSLYADSLGDEDSPASTYLKMLEHNTRTIVEGLSRNKTEAVSDLQHDSPTENYILYALILAIMAGSFFFMVYQLNTGS
jgi:ABC-type Zn uptake system ZnuABC Zn-binding protein ZnuA